MMRKGGAQKMLNEYFDREYERMFNNYPAKSRGISSDT